MHEDRKQFQFGFKSIRMAMLVPFAVLIAAAVLILAFISVQQIENALFENSTDYTMQLVTMVNSDIDSYISNMENLAELVLSNASVGSYLYKDEDEFDENTNEQAIEEQFELLRDTRDDIYNIGIVGDNGRYFINNKKVSINPYAELAGMDWYTKAISGEGEITSSHVQNIVLNEYKWVVTLSRGIVNPETGKTEGVLFIDLNYSSISSLCEKISLGAKGYVFILDEDGSVIYHPKQQLLYNGLLDERIDKILSTPKGGNGTFLSDDGKRLYTITKSEKTGLSVVG
ncbi:MAG TPA: cache domain-containing protein, partial [Lachnospiraceae bacterium]|nr:cache domain-containing protein [Lachnospiraceae bacterium]